jgi:hypothetical protein
LAGRPPTWAPPPPLRRMIATAVAPRRPRSVCQCQCQKARLWHAPRAAPYLSVRAVHRVVGQWRRRQQRCRRPSPPRPLVRGSAASSLPRGAGGWRCRCLRRRCAWRPAARCAPSGLLAHAVHARHTPAERTEVHGGEVTTELAGGAHAGDAGAGSAPGQHRGAAAAAGKWWWRRRRHGRSRVRAGAGPQQPQWGVDGHRPGAI